MNGYATVVGAGLAGSEAALQLAARGVRVRLLEMRPGVPTAVHAGGDCAELVCSNSLKSTKPESAAGMLKRELEALDSRLLAAARRHAVAAGGALAVDRARFAADVTAQVLDDPLITLERREARSLSEAAEGCDAVVVASGPLTSDALARDLASTTGREGLSFFDAAAPIVLADSLDDDVLFRQSRYEDAAGGGDYLNAPFTREEYDAFVRELVGARRAVLRDFESRELFQACQPIEEVARSGHDAPRFGALKPVGLIDPRTWRRPWAAVQLRAEDAACQSYNLVGFQTNLAFPEQRRVFRLIPGLSHAEFSRYGVMHRNTFIDSPRLLDAGLRLVAAEPASGTPVFVAGQLSGTEGYCEAVRSGLHAALSVAALLSGVEAPLPPRETAFGALLSYATDPATADYQPMHVNFGLVPPLERPVRNKAERYRAYAARGEEALCAYRDELAARGLLPAESAGRTGGAR